MYTWEADFLGDGFSYLTMPLSVNDDGPGDATLIRYLPQEDPHALAGTPEKPKFAYLSLHGWNDYFYQPHVAREIAQAGGAFYAIDLRAYGRSLRPWQMPGWTTDIRSYDEDLGRAFDQIKAEHPELPLVFAGHSTGGIIATYWAHRHPGYLAGILLNSPWLDIQTSLLMQKITPPLLSLITSVYSPQQILPLPDTGCYHRILSGYRGEDEVPADEVDDLFWREGGWQPNEKWRNTTDHPTRAGWLAAVCEAQYQVSQGMNIDCPIMVLHSAKSISGQWTSEHRNCDCVLNVEQIRESALKLGSNITILRVEGAVHDIFFSRPKPRNYALAQVKRWIKTYI